MPITEKQRAQRQQHKRLGCSQLPALLNLSQYKTSYDLHLEFSGLLEPNDSVSPDAELGNALEPYVLDKAVEIYGPIIRNQRRAHSDPSLKLAASCDAILRQSNEPIEAKTHGLRFKAKDDWGTPGTDEVPPHVMVQVQGQMMCVSDDCHQAYVGAIVGGPPVVWYEIPRNKEICEMIADALRDFWRGIETGTPPEGLPTLDTLKRLIREEEKSVEIPEELMATWVAANDALKSAKKEEEEAKASVLKALGDAEVGYAGRFGKVTYKGYYQARLDVKALRENAPELVEVYSKEPQLVRRWNYTPPKGETR